MRVPETLPEGLLVTVTVTVLLVLLLLVELLVLLEEVCVVLDV